MSDCILRTTVFSSRDNPDNEITLSLTDGFPNPPALFKLLRSFFAKEIEENKLKVDYDYFSSDTHIHIVLDGLMNWDGIPVSYVWFVYDHDSHEFLRIKAQLFTFLGNSYMSNLERIHKENGRGFQYLPYPEDSDNQIAFIAQYSNATKQYTKEKQDSEVFIILFNQPPLVHIVDASTVLPIEVRSRSTRLDINLSCRCNSLQAISTLEKTSIGKPKEYTLNGSAFIMGCAVKSITLTENTDSSKDYRWTGITIKLLNPEEYTQGEIKLLLADFLLKNKVNVSFDRHDNATICNEMVSVGPTGDIVIHPIVR